MRATLCLAAAVSSLAFIVVLPAIGSGDGARAQTPQAAAPPADAQPQQIKLTAKQVDGVLAAHKEISAIEAKIPEGADKPDAKAQADLDRAAKKYGFANYAEYSDVGATLSMAMSGFDPQTKKFVGPAVVIKQQIAEVQADKKMPAKDKKEALADLNGSLQSAGSTKILPGNVDLVSKNYDKLAEIMQQDQ